MNENTAGTSHSAASASLPARFFIADWCVDQDQQTIGNAQQSITLEPKMLAVLVYLAETAGATVSREALEETVWAGTVVGYDALTTTINKLRKVLGDDSSNPRFIKTIPKKGYCLIAAVTLPATDTDKPVRTPRISNKKLWLSTLALIGIMLAALLWMRHWQAQHLTPNNSGTALPTLVVLPFEDLNQTPGQGYFSHGITADITTALSKLSGLFVISWQSAASLSGNSSQEIRAIAKQYKVQYVLQGSLRRLDNRVRINAQLLDANSGVNLWAERYDREITTVLDLQDEIATEIASALSITLTKQEIQRQSRRYTTNFAAYDLFLQGQSAYVRGNHDDNLLARSLFQAAIDKDPDFARAYGALALTYADEYRFNWGNDAQQALDRAFTLVSKAVALDDQLPQAYWVRSYINLQRHEYAASVASAQTAIELDPNNPDGYAMLALSQIHNGNPQAALRLIRKAMNLSPHYPARYPSLLGQAYYYLGRYEEAIYPLQEARKRNIELITPHIYLIVALQKAGQHDEAAWEASKLKGKLPNFKVENIPQIIPNNKQKNIEDIMQQLRKAGL